MRGVLKAIPLGALGFAAAALVACGGDDKLLPGSDATNLQAAVADVQRACAAGDSAGAERAAQGFSDRVAELSPQDVDRRLIANLQAGATKLEALAAQSCESTTTPTTPTTPTTTTTTPTTPTTTVPTTPTTTTPPEPTTPTTPTTPTVPPDNGGGGPPDDGPGNGNGNGPPGGVPPGQVEDPSGGGASPESTP